MTAEDIKRRLAAILSADAKDYSRLMREDEAATVRTLTIYREVMGTLIQQHHGRVVDSPGDNLLAEFASVVDAVQGAVAIQKELKSRNAALPDTRRMAFRIGINLGDVIVEGDRIYGDGVNIAARLEALADPGGICISRTAFDQIEDKLPLGYEYLGEKAVKNISKPVRAYKVLLEPGEKTTGTSQEKQAERPEPHTSRHFKDKVRKRHIQPRLDRKVRFRRHFRTYIIVIGFLLIVNILTYGGNLWFHWPALGWGFLLLLHWSRGSRPLSRRATKTPTDVSVHELNRRKPGDALKYLRIQVEPKNSEFSEDDRVNIRVPIRLLRRGVKLGKFIPGHAKSKINDALKDKGFDFDISTLDGEKLEALLESVSDLSLDVEKDDRKVRIFLD